MFIYVYWLSTYAEFDASSAAIGMGLKAKKAKDLCKKNSKNESYMRHCNISYTNYINVLGKHMAELEIFSTTFTQFQVLTNCK